MAKQVENKSKVELSKEDEARITEQSKEKGEASISKAQKAITIAKEQRTAKRNEKIVPVKESEEMQREGHLVVSMFTTKNKDGEFVKMHKLKLKGG